MMDDNVFMLLQAVALDDMEEAQEYASDLFPYGNNILMLLNAVVACDMEEAKFYALRICAEDTSDLPDDFREWLLEHFLADGISLDSLLPEQGSVPPDISTMLVIEDVTKTFNPRRYWVSEREQKVLEDIISLKESSKIMEKAKMPFLNSTLLYGQSGTGKTQFGRYVAHVLGLPFAWVRLSNVVGSAMGETSYNIHRVFEFIQSFPCVFMLDELDAICTNRNLMNGGASDEFTRATITLMQCLDLVRQDIVVIAASNQEGNLDPAVRRRFTSRHEVRSLYPDESYEMIVAYLQDVKETGELEFTWEEEDIRNECRTGRSQADLISLCNRAVLRAVQTNGVVSLSEENKRTTKKSGWI